MTEEKKKNDYYDLPEDDPLYPYVRKHGITQDNTYGIVIINGYRCRNCGSVRNIKLVKYISGRVYTLCKECYTEYIPEELISTYGWSYPKLRDRDLKMQKEIMKNVRL